jgi:hypothetical protein
VWHRIVDEIGGRRMYPEDLSRARRVGGRVSILLKPENLCFWFRVKEIEGRKGGFGGFVRGM